MRVRDVLISQSQHIGPSIIPTDIIAPVHHSNVRYIGTQLNIQRIAAVAQTDFTGNCGSPGNGGFGLPFIIENCEPGS